MKKIITAVVITAFSGAAIAGCSAGEVAALKEQVQGLSEQLEQVQSQTAAPGTTPAAAVSPESLASAAPSALPSPSVQASQGAAPLTAEEILAQLADIDGLEDELDLKQEQLKLSLRNGEITREDYIAQKAELDLQDDELGLRQDELELQLYDAANSTAATARPAPSASPAKTPAATIAPQKTPAAAASQNAAPQAQNSADTSSGASNTGQSIEQRRAALEDEWDALEQQYKSGQIDYNTFQQREADIASREQALDLEEDNPGSAYDSWSDDLSDRYNNWHSGHDRHGDGHE